MVLKPPLYAVAAFATGDLYGQDLPLENVTYGSSLNAGAFSASLDMRKVAASIAQARDVREWLTPGAVTVVPLYEGLWAGTAQPPVSRAAGEWWITGVEASWDDPVIRLTGVELPGYLKQRHLTDAWSESNIDAVYLARMAIGDAFQKGQSIALQTNDWNSQRRILTTFEAAAGSRTYWDLVQDISAGRLEWHIDTNLVMSGVVPVRVQRWLRIAEGFINRVRDDAVMEIAPEGYVGSLRSATRDTSAVANELWGFGAGSGVDQPTSRHTAARPGGVPIISGSATWSEAMSWAELNVLGRGALDDLQDGRRPFQLTVRDFVPRVGETYPYIQAPSLSMPTAVQGRVRCVAWTWSSQNPSAFVLDVVPY